MRGAAPVLPQGRKAPWRSTPGCASQDFAEATCRAGANAPRSRASTPTIALGLGSHGSAMPPAAISSGSGKYRNDGSTGQGSTTPGAISWGMRNTSVRGSRRRVSTAAMAELVVPRSTPIRNGVGGISHGSALADVQLQLPAICAVSRVAPELERPDLSDAALERHGDDPIVCRGGQARIGLERHLERTEFFEIVAPVLDDCPRRIALADR